MDAKYMTITEASTPLLRIRYEGGMLLRPCYDRAIVPAPNLRTAIRRDLSVLGLTCTANAGCGERGRAGDRSPALSHPSLLKRADVLTVRRPTPHRPTLRPTPA